MEPFRLGYYEHLAQYPRLVRYGSTSTYTMKTRGNLWEVGWVGWVGLLGYVFSQRKGVKILFLWTCLQKKWCPQSGVGLIPCPQQSSKNRFFQQLDVLVLSLCARFISFSQPGSYRGNLYRHRHRASKQPVGTKYAKYTETGLDQSYKVLLRRQMKAGIKKRRRVWTLSQYVVCTIYFNTSKTSNSSWLCLNKNLPEMSHYDPDSGSGALGR